VALAARAPRSAGESAEGPGRPAAAAEDRDPGLGLGIKLLSNYTAAVPARGASNYTAAVRAVTPAAPWHTRRRGRPRRQEPPVARARRTTGVPPGPFRFRKEHSFFPSHSGPSSSQPRL
jgi:hypothetical protein